VILELAFKDFMQCHEIDNQSQHTLKNYKRYIKKWLAWLGEQEVTDTDQLDITHLRSWVAWMQQGNLKDSTIRCEVIHTVAFCHWLEQEEILPKNITRRFKIPQAEKKFIPTFTPEEVQLLLDACEDTSKTRSPAARKALTARNKAILAVLIDTGVRVSELVSLRLGDIDKDLRILVVHRKGNKWQQVPISRDGFKYLHEYLTKYRKILARQDIARKEDPVFLGRDNGDGLSVAAIQCLFDRLKKKTGIEGKRVSPHNCRRYMATTQLAAGRSPLDVQRQMGHTTLTMTNHYASLSVEHLQKTHEQFSPLRGNNQEQGKSSYWG
jgi:site-specific recombinase XerD